MRVSLVTVFALLAAWAIALAPRAAYAQTTAGGPSVLSIITPVQRLEPDGHTSADNANEHPHPGSVLVNAINFEDCDADLIYQFELNISGLNNGYNLDVWAGTADCSQLANRQAATAVCWPVTVPIQANANPFVLKVRMQDIVSQTFQTTHTVGYQHANSDVCQLQTATGATNISLYFFFEQNGNATGNVAPYPVTVDTRAGDVQGPITAGVGDTLLIIDIPPTTDTDTQGWNVYCDPPPGKESAVENIPADAPTNNGTCPAQIPDTGTTGVSEAGDALASFDGSEDGPVDSAVAEVDSAPPPPTLDDAGGNACGAVLNDSGIPSPGGCSSSSVLVAGGGGSSLVSTVDEAGNTVIEEGGTSVVSTSADGGSTVAISGGTMKLIPPGYLCATGSVGATQLNVLGLKNGVYYNIAVAAIDAVGNVGPLSNVPCGEPVPVNDFWKLYYAAGGRAGGGFCSAEGVGTPAGTSGLGALMIASIAAMVRRRRRK